MRPYFSFGYGDKKIGISLLIGDEEKEDLVGYGYDTPPILRSLKIHIVFIELVFGLLIIQD